MDVVAEVPEYMQYNAGPNASQGLLIDERHHRLIRLNRAGRLAWEALERGSWADSCKAFSESLGIEREKAETVLLSFAKRLSQQGWICLQVGAETGANHDDE